MNYGVKKQLTHEELEVKIAEYLLTNPAPKDLEFHAFASGLGVSKESLEEISYNMLSTFLNVAASWGLLHQDPALMHNAMYMAGCDPESAVVAVQSVCPKASPNIVEVALRMRHADSILRAISHRGSILSYAEETELDSELHKKRGDRVAVNDQNRIATVTAELNKLGVSQNNVDTAARLLDLDHYKDESALLTSSYTNLREALVASTTFVFDDPRFVEMAKYFDGLAQDRRDYGDKIRVARARQCSRLMRILATDYGVSNRGLFSAISN